MTDKYLRDILRKYIESFSPFTVYPSIPEFVFTLEKEALLNKMVANIQEIIQEENIKSVNSISWLRGLAIKTSSIVPRGELWVNKKQYDE